MDNKEAVFFTKEDGSQWVSRHPSDPQHSLHRFYNLGGFLLALVIIWIISIVFMIILPVITLVSSSVTLEMMNSSQFSDIFTASDIALVESSIEIYSYPPYLAAYIVSLVLMIAFIVVVFMRKNIYLQLLIADAIVTLVFSIVSVLFTFNYMSAFTGVPSELISIGSIIGVMTSLIPTILIIVYFLVSKRVKVYFKSPREEHQIII